MKRFKLINILFLILTFISISFLSPLKVKAETNTYPNGVNIYIFYNQECLHCQEESKFLNELENEYGDKISIYKYEIFYNEENEAKFTHIRNNIIEFEGNSVPFTIVGKTTFSGYNDTIKFKILSAINYYSENSYRDYVGKYLGVIDQNIDLESIDDHYYDPVNEYIRVPFIGLVNIKDLSLPVISSLIGLIDGFNPCAMWVLLFLITMLLNMKDRKRMWILGISFLVTSALVYLLIMILWLNVMVSVATIQWVRYLISLVAFFGGAYNIYIFFRDRKDEGCHVVKKEKRVKIFNKIKNLTNEKTNFFLAIGGMITLAISVNVVELACSAGLPLIFTQILAMNDLTTLEYILYFFLYILFFLIDDLVVFFIAMTTLKITGTSTKYGKISQIVGGIILVIIGLLMMFKPEWLMFNL